jgi:hypothetical protein
MADSYYMHIEPMIACWTDLTNLSEVPLTRTDLLLHGPAI